MTYKVICTICDESKIVNGQEQITIFKMNHVYKHQLSRIQELSGNFINVEESKGE